MNGFRVVGVKAGRPIRKVLQQLGQEMTEAWTKVSIGEKWSDLSYMV